MPPPALHRRARRTPGLCWSAFICVCGDTPEPENDTWVILTAKMDYKFHRAYGRRGPVMTALSWEKAEPPEQPVATFY